MLIYFLLLIIMSTCDSLIASIFPYDPSFVGFSFVPHLAFMCLVLLARKLDFKSTIFMAVALGVIQDIYLNQTFLLYMILNIALVFVAHFWSQSVSDSNVENILFMTSALFIREVVLYLIMLFSKTTSISVAMWFIKREFLTLTFNVFLAIVVLVLVKKIYEHIDDKDLLRRKKENIRWINPSIKRKG